MKNSILLIVTLACLSGCQNLHDKSDVRVSRKTLDKIDPPTPNVITAPAPTQTSAYYLPGTDKVYIAGDRLVAFHETDSQQVLVSKSARRLIAGNAADGDLSYQPALLEKELAEELARSRTINADTRSAIAKMMGVTHQLILATQELTARNKELAQKLEQQVAYSGTLETKLAGVAGADKNKK